MTEYVIIAKIFLVLVQVLQLAISQSMKNFRLFREVNSAGSLGCDGVDRVFGLCYLSRSDLNLIDLFKRD